MKMLTADCDDLTMQTLCCTLISLPLNVLAFMLTQFVSRTVVQDQPSFDSLQ